MWCVQAYYLNAPFPVERAPTVCFSARKRKRSVKISELRQYPVRGLVFEAGSTLQELATAVAKVCTRLQDRNRPFNVLIADSGARVFVFPQCFAERQARGEVEGAILDTQVNPAAWEISGHIVLKRKEDYERATQVSPPPSQGRIHYGGWTRQSPRCQGQVCGYFVFVAGIAQVHQLLVMSSVDVPSAHEGQYRDLSEWAACKTFRRLA